MEIARQPNNKLVINPVDRVGQKRLLTFILEYFMKLLSTLIAAVFALVTFSAVAADAPMAAPAAKTEATAPAAKAKAKAKEAESAKKAKKSKKTAAQ